MYIGRFAPTPSGELHIGSLSTAIGSYLRAKSLNGKWLVRIEDLDIGRCHQETSYKILKTLERYNLEYDDSVLFQSKNLHRYQEILSELTNKNLTYPCNCNRRRLKEIGNIYDGKCYKQPYKQTTKDEYAIRFKNPATITTFADNLQGDIYANSDLYKEDFILKRRDGIFSYNLAVIVDDYDSNITEIVRGSDLLDVTLCQINLISSLGWPIPSYLHLPLILQDNNLKYSKQNHAKMISDKYPEKDCALALRCLGYNEPLDLQKEKPEIQLKWAIQNFDIQNIRKDNINISY